MSVTCPIAGVVGAVQSALQSADLEHEIIVVDDSSEDDTFAIASLDGVRVLRHQSNRGYGAALKTGIRHARYPLICITDADGTYSSELIPERSVLA